ncbi:hypothetical protein PLESTB_000494500 [Pleodorina starrii]|uniref:Cilia- and flagella-associated protein 69 ARM repeats domain-containing protein n=1 Tax=Pleodorina starrii TaxID=330485 RepID=A0A9W6BGG9_9CHLO|nr:hypothetical protein PLESTM_000366000 [Pleodorina starrii]GLC51365.1 hypothetical protein PLESTB_000494500 [Pleodorina starrii]GLC63730.1 hypothetical protein PLESTF_000068000 [Pleodorina starrii]
METTTAPSGPAVDLDKVIALFTGPNSADLYDRHIAAINRLCRSNPNGFAIRDLPKVQQVLELSIALLQRGSTLFLEPLCELVSLMGKPFIRRTATDEFKMLNHITNVLAAVGSILRSAGLPPHLQIIAAQMITTFANAYGNRPNVLELSQQQSDAEGTQRQYLTNQSLLNKSGVVVDLITALARSLLAAEADTPTAAGAAAATDAALVAPVTVALLALSYNADNCTSMVEAGVMQCLAALLARGARDETMCTTVELTWNVVENAPAARAVLAQPLPSLQRLARRSSGDGGAAVGNGGAGEAAAKAGPGPGSSSLAAASGGGSGGGGALESGPSFRSSLGRPGGSLTASGLEGTSAGGGGGGRGAAASSRGSVGALGFSPGTDGGGGGDVPGDDWLAITTATLTSMTGSRSQGDSLSLRGGAAANGNGNSNSQYDDFGDTPDLRFGLGGGGGGGGAESPDLRFGLGGGGGGGGAESPDFAEDAAAANAAAADVAAAAAVAAVAADALVVQPLADALAALLRWLLLHGFSRADKELRNDVVVVLNLLLESGEFRAAAAAAGAFEPLLTAATCPELAARPELVAPYALTTDAHDHELRLLAWAAVVHGCLLPEVLETAVAGGLVRVLLLYVNVGEGHPAVRRWNPDQLSTLRAGALSRLHTLSPLCPEEYERAGGPGTLLAFVAAAPSAGAAAAAAAGHLEGALRHLHHLFTLVPETRDGFGAAGLIPVLLGIVADAVGNGGGAAAAGGRAGSAGGSAAAAAASGGQPEGVRHFALLCLNALCTVHAENQRRLRKAGGVGVLLGALARLRGLDPLLPAPYAVAVLDCVWAAVVPDRKSTARWLVERGMDHVLSHLEGGNKGHRPVALRLLSDLLENPRSHPFFHEWKSDVNKQSAAHLLLSLWMEEDTLRGMSGPDGLLANPANPLAGLEKRTRWLPPENVAYGNMSAAKKEVVTLMMDNLVGEVVLAKIYGIFKILGFDSCSYLEPRDHAVLAAVEKYAKFRQGDVWRGIQTEFDAAGMQPTAPDRLRLESGIELSESLAVAVREAQGRLLGRAQEGLAAKETRLFEGMRQQAKLEAEYRYIQLQERTPLTLEEMRRAKENKATMLKNSLQSFQFQQQGGEE